MGSRDYRRRERKKPKKDAKKALTASVVPPPVAVEVLKAKGKRERKEEE